MQKKTVILRAACVLLAVWVGVFAVRWMASSKRITAERVQEAVSAANFDDWSDPEFVGNPAEAKRREAELRKIAGMINRLDFAERERSRETRAGEEFFYKLSVNERATFIDLTITESMTRFMAALDAMPAEQRRNFVEQGLREIREGRTEADLARAEEMDGEVVDTIAREGMKAFFEKSSAETKLDLAPLMEAMNEVMQGLRGNEFGMPRG